MRSKKLVSELNSTLKAYIGQPCYVVGAQMTPCLDEPYIDEYIVQGFIYDGKHWCIYADNCEFEIDADVTTIGFTATLSKEEANEIYNELRKKYERNARL